MKPPGGKVVCNTTVSGVPTAANISALASVPAMLLLVIFLLHLLLLMTLSVANVIDAVGIH